MGLMEALAGSSLTLVFSLKKRLRVARPFSRRATTMSPSVAISVSSQTTKSPSKIPSSRMLSPLTLRTKAFFLPETISGETLKVASGSS